MDLNYWNEKIYKNPDGSWVIGGMYAKEFFAEFGIESYPLFENKCYYHIPETWAEDIRIFLKSTKDLGDRIEFKQIKEKFCELTVYYSAKDEEARATINKLVGECINRLIAKGVYPPRNV
jgi:hypothetical protein